MSYKRIGKQEPRIRIEPSRVCTDGADAAYLSTSYGMRPDDWQRTVLDAWLGRDALDRFTATTCGLSVPRQNGKNAILEMREFYGLVAIGEQILHSAHEVKTAATAFRRLASFFENSRDYPELTGMCERVRRTNGQEAIELKNGGRIVFSARSRGAARGMTFDLVVFDEAQEVTDEHLEAMMFTMAAAPLGNRQVIYTGTPPSPNSRGEVFGRIRNMAVKNADADICWHEWSVDSIGDVTDVSRWYETNPALGIRLDEAFTATECQTMTPDGFARERLGWWTSAKTANSVFERTVWEACAVSQAPMADEVLAAGVKFSPDGEHAALSMAAKQHDGTVYMECVEYAPVTEGMGWLVSFLKERRDRIAVCVIDGKANTAQLAQRLVDVGFPRKGIAIARVKDVTDAASMLLGACIEKQAFHGDQPLLNESALSAQKRLIGHYGAWAFGPGEVSSLPVESASLAYFGAKTTKRRPGRKAVVF